MITQSDIETLLYTLGKQGYLLSELTDEEIEDVLEKTRGKTAISPNFRERAMQRMAEAQRKRESE